MAPEAPPPQDCLKEPGAEGLIPESIHQDTLVIRAAEVQPGDIILGINGRRVHSVKELQDAAKSAGKSVALLIQREDAQIFVPLRLP